MLDRATLEKLSRTPEKNAPTLNVALAEEGVASVLLSLARSPAVGPEALAVVDARIASEGAAVGRDAEAPADEDFERVDGELDRLLAAHPRAADDTRDAVMARHPGEAWFVLAAAAHPRATLVALERAIDWPSASPVHDRLWLALLDAARVPPLTLEEWAADPSSLRREAAARIGREPAPLERLAADASRQVRRAVASNHAAAALREVLATRDAAPEVRARAAGAIGAHDTARSEGRGWVDSARFAAALRAMESGGVLAPDVTRALCEASTIDEEGARIAAQVLPRAELAGLVQQLVDAGVDARPSLQLAAGLALRAPRGDGDIGEHTEIIYDTVKALSRTTTADSRLTGKARLAAWAADGLALLAEERRARAERAAGELTLELARAPLGADRMVLARGAHRCRGLVAELCAAAVHPGSAGCDVPAALLELAWNDASIDDATVLALSARVARPRQRAEDLPEDELDLDPRARTLETLERVVLAATPRANLAPRSALTVVALDSRRVRYVLTAMPQWKGSLTGGRLARVLRQHAGALSAAQAEARTRQARIEGWTERRMNEIELAVALAVGHLTSAEVVRRIQIGRQELGDGTALAAGVEVRAALEGPSAAAPVLAWATRERAARPAALALWLLLERFERERAPAQLSAAIDALAAAPAPSGAAGKGVLAATVGDALALLERRHPGRLEGVFPQSPRGRATLASALARAYRAVGGMAHERSG